MPPWASMESHSSTLPFESMTTSVLVGRLSAAYSPATPQPAITTSQLISSYVFSAMRPISLIAPDETRGQSPCLIPYFAAYSSMRSSVSLAWAAASGLTPI